MTGRSEVVVSCVAAGETRSTDHLNKSVIITTTGQRPLQIQIVGNHTLASTKGSLAEKKTIVSKKTKKIETRVQRQVVLEDGKIVADSGPQVITRTLEDTNTENNDMGKNSAQLLVQGEPDLPCNSDPSVVRSVSRMRTTMKSASKEVNHYHDEERREITNPAELERGIKSPETLLEPIENEFPSEVKGELKFFSSKSKGVVCKEKVNEVSRLDDNGNLRTVTTHTRHEEETEDSELPDQNVPSKLPDLTPDLTQCQRFVGDVVLLPITQEPCIKNSSPSPKSWSTSNEAKAAPASAPKSWRKSGSWTIERKTGKGGDTELVGIKRRDMGSNIWDNHSVIRYKESPPAAKTMPRFPPLQRRVLDKTIASSYATSRRTAERRQRGVLLDGHEACPSPPSQDEENHYELLWDARTGERRSPSPAKSETFTKARGRRIAQLLSQRRAASKRSK